MGCSQSQAIKVLKTQQENALNRTLYRQSLLHMPLNTICAPGAAIGRLQERRHEIIFYRYTVQFARL